MKAIVATGNTLKNNDPAAHTIPGTYCIVAHNTDGTLDRFYNSDAGGLQASNVTMCA